MIRRYTSLLAALLALAPAHAQPPALESAVVDARLESPHRLVVEARYFLRPAGASEIDLTALPFDGARAANVRAFIGEHEVSFRARASADGRLDGAVQLPVDADRATLRVSWEVLRDDGASPGWLSIPILVASWPPQEPLPQTFAATVTLPAGTIVRSAFPTGFERVAPIERTSDANVYRVELPVMPALLRLQTADASAAGLTLERTVDLLTFATLLALGILGWRRLREALG